MTSPAPTTSCTRCLPVVGAGYSLMTKHLPGQSRNFVMRDNPSTAYRDVAPGSEALPLVEDKPASSQARQWQPTRMILESAVEDTWHPCNLTPC